MAESELHAKMARMIVRFSLLAALALLLAFAPMPARSAVCELDGAEDAALQWRLARLLDEQGLSAAVRRGDLAVSLLILTDPWRPRLAQVNGDHMIYAASLPKIAILLGAAVELDEGSLEMDPMLELDIQNMIRFSCNQCANRVLERVGPERMLEILQAPRYAFYDADHGGGLWLGKPYGPSPAFHREPLEGLSHAATTFQVARFYCSLRRGTLVGPEQTQFMRGAMAHPGIRHKFVKGLAGHDDIEMYRKSGSWRDFHSDSALVETGDQAYVMVAIAHNKRGSVWLERLAEPLHSLALSTNSFRSVAQRTLVSTPTISAAQ
jgi:beta-lactamase class A